MKLTDYHVYRGGSWFNYADYYRVADRYGNYPPLRNYGLGFRLILH